MDAVTLPNTPLVIALFGPIQVMVDGQPLPHLRSRKALWLLALLTLRHGRPVERGWLAGTLWPDIDQDKAYRNLRVVLSELRNALGSQGWRLMAANRHTLRIELTGATVDVATFDASLENGKPPALELSIALYRGPLLEGCTEEWVVQERDTRERGFLKALQNQADGASANGNHDAAVGYWQRAVEIAPLWDVAQRGLMKSLAARGDLNEALQAYRAFAHYLKSDPKAAPDAQTTELYARLRAEAQRLVREPATVKSEPVPVPPTVTGNLPHPLTELIGREDECLEVAARLRRSRLVTLTGPGGIGKTRLAIQVASDIPQDFADGAWLVLLESLSDSAMVPEQIARVLGVRDEPGKPPLQRLTDALRTKRVLLILDNCEHLVEACAQVTAHLLRECAGLRMLATSRAVLGITGEVVWTVPALAVPDPSHLPSGGTTLVRVLAGYEGVQLFVERAEAVQKGFALTRSNAQAVASVCSQLEGIPLAIELAAARVRAMTTEQIAARLPDYLGLLMSRHRGTLPRQDTLQATLDWSYDLLGDRECTLLRRLSVFAGGCDLAAAESVCAGDGLSSGQILGLLTGLVDKSMVVFQERAETDGGRYRLLEMVRQYGMEKLQASAEAEQVRERHRDWFLALAEEAELQLRGVTQEVWLRRLEIENGNFRAAFAFCESEAEGAQSGLRLAVALSRYWDDRGLWSEGRRYLERALKKAEAERETPVLARALRWAGTLACNQGDTSQAQILLEKGQCIFEELRDYQGLAASLNNLSNVAKTLGDYTAARSHLEKGLQIYRNLGDRRGIALISSNLGGLIRQQGDYATAATLLEESLHIYRELGDGQRVALMLSNLGNLRRLQGDYATAQAILEESLQMRRQMGNKVGIAWALSSLSAVARARDDFDGAQSLLEECLTIRKELGDKAGTAWALLGLGAVACLCSDYVTSQRLSEESLRLFQEFKNKGGVAWSLDCLGIVARAKGDYAVAQDCTTKSLRLFQELGDTEGVASALQNSGDLLLALSTPLRAVCLWGTAASLRERIGALMFPRDREESEYRMQQARSVLGVETFSAAWEMGQAMTWEKAVAYALE